jgi:hypothetical protein
MASARLGAGGSPLSPPGVLEISSDAAGPAYHKGPRIDLRAALLDANTTVLALRLEQISGSRREGACSHDKGGSGGSRD